MQKNQQTEPIMDNLIIPKSAIKQSKKIIVHESIRKKNTFV